MADTDEGKEHPPVVYCALPEIEDKQHLIFTSEVDLLVGTVMEMANVPPERLQQAIEGFGQQDDPEDILECKKHFLATMFRKSKWNHLPEAFFAPLMRLAVDEPNPSFNRGFIEPCLRAFGYQRVQQALLKYLENGTNREKAGAARACYWAWLPLIFEDAKAFQKMSYELADLRLQRNILLLKTFVENEDLDVRRSIIPGLILKPSSYPEKWQSLIPLAIHLARTHPDEYIRHRVEIQLRYWEMDLPVQIL